MRGSFQFGACWRFSSSLAGSESKVHNGPKEFGSLNQRKTRLVACGNIFLTREKKQGFHIRCMLDLSILEISTTLFVTAI